MNNSPKGFTHYCSGYDFRHKVSTTAKDMFLRERIQQFHKSVIGGLNYHVTHLSPCREHMMVTLIVGSAKTRIQVEITSSREGSKLLLFFLQARSRSYESLERMSRSQCSGMMSWFLSMSRVLYDLYEAHSTPTPVTTVRGKWGCSISISTGNLPQAMKSIFTHGIYNKGNALTRRPSTSFQDALALTVLAIFNVVTVMDGREWE